MRYLTVQDLSKLLSTRSDGKVTELQNASLVHTLWKECYRQRAKRNTTRKIVE